MPHFFKTIGTSIHGLLRSSKQAYLNQQLYYRKREKEISEKEKLLRGHEDVKVAKTMEKQRQKNFRLKQKAAFKIQKAWKKYKMRQFGILTVAKQSIHQLQTQAGAEEFQKQIAALTIQLAWRKYYRRKLLRSLTPNRRQLHLWDPEVIAMKQKALVKQIYGELPPVPCWHPTPKKPARPYWSKWVPSAAALSYNFAVDRYHPLVSKKGFLPSPFIDNQGYPRNFDWNPLEDEDLANNLRSVRVPNTTMSKSRQYSYNISRGGTGYRSSTFI